MAFSVSQHNGTSMSKHGKCVYIFLFCILLNNHKTFAAVCGQSPSPAFITHLLDQHVKVGQDAEFVCAVVNFYRSSDTLIWQIVPDINRKEVEEQITAVTGELVSTLTLHEVDTTKLHVSCRVTYRTRSTRSGSRACHITTSASLVVEYFPHRDDLTCSPQNPPGVRDGGVLSVWCQVPRCQPAVDLSWKFHNHSDERLPLPVIEDKGNMRVLRKYLQIHTGHHLKSIVCLVTSEVTFPDRQLECKVGPIKVFQIPRILKKLQVVNITRGSSIDLTCQASGFPTPTYSWSCSPYGVLNGCHGTSHSVTLSIAHGISQDISGGSVECSASNQEGIDSSNTRIIFTNGTDLVSFPNNQSVFSVHIELFDNNVGMNWIALCFLYPNDTGHIPVFSWFVDGAIVSDEENITIHHFSNNTSLFQTFSHDTLVGRSQVYCKANISDSLVITSKTIMLSSINNFPLDNSPEGRKRPGHTKTTSNIQQTWTAMYSKYRSEEMTSSQLWKSAINESVNQNNGPQTSLLHLSLSRVVTIVVTWIASFVILVACVAGMIAIILRKCARQYLTTISGKAANEQSEIKTDRADISTHDAIYEIPALEQTVTPNSDTLSGESVITSPHNKIQHIYNTQVYMSSSSSANSSLESVFSQSFESTSSDNFEGVTFHHDQTGVPVWATYINQAVGGTRSEYPQMSEITGRESFSSDVGIHHTYDTNIFPTGGISSSSDDYSNET